MPSFDVTQLTKILAFDSYDDYIAYIEDDPSSEYILGIVGAGGNIPSYIGYDIQEDDPDQTNWDTTKKVLYIGATDSSVTYNHIYGYASNTWVDEGYNENIENYSNVYYGDRKVTDIIVTTDTPTSASVYPNNKIYVQPVYSVNSYPLSGQASVTPIGYRMYLKYADIVAPIEGSTVNPFPPAPTTDGTYQLICTVSNGMPSYSWQSTT